MNYPESNTQQACVKWFRLQYPELSYLLISVPNGGKRFKQTARILKSEGTVAGVADLLLLVPTQHYACLAIEMKSEKGKIQPSQELWKLEFERFTTHKYIICRSFEQFVNEINNYLK